MHHAILLGTCLLIQSHEIRLFMGKRKMFYQRLLRVKGE